MTVQLPRTAFTALEPRKEGPPADSETRVYSAHLLFPPQSSLSLSPSLSFSLSFTSLSNRRTKWENVSCRRQLTSPCKTREWAKRVVATFRTFARLFRRLYSIWCVRALAGALTSGIRWLQVARTLSLLFFRLVRSVKTVLPCFEGVEMFRIARLCETPPSYRSWFLPAARNTTRIVGLVNFRR